VSFVQGFKKDAQKYGVKPETKNVFELIPLEDWLPRKHRNVRWGNGLPLTKYYLPLFTPLPPPLSL
jgi:hypothetical protein